MEISKSKSTPIIIIAVLIVFNIISVFVVWRLISDDQIREALIYLATFYLLINLAFIYGLIKDNKRPRSLLIEGDSLIMTYKNGSKEAIDLTKMKDIDVVVVRSGRTVKEVIQITLNDSSKQKIDVGGIVGFVRADKSVAAVNNYLVDYYQKKHGK